MSHPPAPTAELVEKIGPELLPIFAMLAVVVRHQDKRYGPMVGDLPGVRLGIAVLEDEVAEALQAWRDERRDEGWPATGVEVFQVAAVAVRLFRDSRGAQ